MNPALASVAVTAGNFAPGRLTVALAIAGASFTSMAAAWAAPPSSETSSGPCDSLTDYLRTDMAGPEPVILHPNVIDTRYDGRESRLEESLRSTSPTSPLAYAGRVTPACRAEARRGAPAAEAATDAARAWTRRPEPGWIDRGRIIRCAMQDLLAYNELDVWMDDFYLPEARAVCASALATWPDAEQARDRYFARAVRKNHDSLADWEIDEAFVAAANVLGTPELREQLLPVLATAHTRQAVGYDRLRDTVCTDDGMMSSARAQACSALPAGAEQGWRRDERPRQWRMRGGVTALYGGMVAASFFSRNDANGRAIPTLAGVVGGAIAGVTVVVAATADRQTRDGQFALAGKVLASELAGAVIGGVALHRLASSPGARAPLTALGLAPLYLTLMQFTFD